MPKEKLEEIKAKKLIRCGYYYPMDLNKIILCTPNHYCAWFKQKEKFDISKFLKQRQAE